MIVPFIMTMLTISDLPYLWSFYKFISIAQKQRGVVIAQEDYFTPPSIFKKRGREEVISKAYMERAGYPEPNDLDIENLDKYVISKEIEENLIRKLGSHNNAQNYILRDRWLELEEILLKYTDEIKNKYNEPIEAIITLSHYPSLEIVAKKIGAKLIHVELGALREPAYLRTAYWDFNDLYGKVSSVEERYNIFKGEKESIKLPLLTNKEILALFYNKEYMKYLHKLDELPKFKMGVALGYTTWPHFLVNTFMNDEELLFQVSKNYEMQEFITRSHPGDPAKSRYSKYDYSRDIFSANTIDFILQCERVCSLGSNVSFEAMLYGRTGYTMTYYPPYYKTKHDIYDKELLDIDNKYINYYIFGYMIPYAFMADVNYILWRLTNPSETEIYSKNLKFYLELFNIQLKDKANYFENIIKAKHYDSSDTRFPKPNRPIVLTAREYQIIIEKLNSEIEKKNMIINAINEKEGETL